MDTHIDLDALLKQAEKTLMGRDHVDAELLVKHAVKLLPSLMNDKEKIYCCHTIYQLMEFLGKNEESLPYIDNVLALSSEYSVKVHFFIEKALCYMRMKQKGKALPIFQEILDLAWKKNDEEMLARVSSYFAKYYQQEKDFLQALKYWNEAIGYARKIHNLPMEASANSDIALIFYDMKKYNLALESLRKAEDLAVDGKNKFYIYQTALRRCKIYMELGNMDQVRNIIDSTFKLNTPNSL